MSQDLPYIHNATRRPNPLLHPGLESFAVAAPFRVLSRRTSHAASNCTCRRQLQKPPLACGAASARKHSPSRSKPIRLTSPAAGSGRCGHRRLFIHPVFPSRFMANAVWGPFMLRPRANAGTDQLPYALFQIMLSAYPSLRSAALCTRFCAACVCGGI